MIVFIPLPIEFNTDNKKGVIAVLRWHQKDIKLTSFQDKLPRYNAIIYNKDA
jgi:hypothetical protein